MDITNPAVGTIGFMNGFGSPATRKKRTIVMYVRIAIISLYATEQSQLQLQKEFDDEFNIALTEDYGMYKLEMLTFFLQRVHMMHIDDSPGNN